MPLFATAGRTCKQRNNVSDVAASGLVLTQVGYNCGTRPPIDEGDFVVVFVDGMVGHWAAQTLAARGAKIALVGRHDERLGKYRLKSGDILINEKRDEVLPLVKQWATTGVQAVVDTVGSIAAFQSLYPVMRNGGHIVSPVSTANRTFSTFSRCALTS